MMPPEAQLIAGPEIWIVSIYQIKKGMDCHLKRISKTFVSCCWNIFYVSKKGSVQYNNYAGKKNNHHQDLFKTSFNKIWVLETKISSEIQFKIIGFKTPNTDILDNILSEEKERR